MLKNALHFSHDLLKKVIVPGVSVVDATVGNGGDTVLLAQLVGETGAVFGFDIQEEALKRTKEKLLLTGLLDRVRLFNTSHENANKNIPANVSLSAAVFNLGYLPSGNKKVTTTSTSTLKAIEELLPRLKIGGILLVMVYWGHPEGSVEKESLLDWLPQLSQKEFDVLQYQFINQKNAPPFLLVIEKKK